MKYFFIIAAKYLAVLVACIFIAMFLHGVNSPMLLDDNTRRFLVMISVAIVGVMELIVSDDVPPPITKD